MADLYRYDHLSVEPSIRSRPSEDTEDDRGDNGALLNEAGTRDKSLLREDSPAEWTEDKEEYDGEDTPLMHHGHAAGFPEASPVLPAPLAFPFSAGERRKSFYFPSERKEGGQQAGETQEAGLEEGAPAWAEGGSAGVHKDAVFAQSDRRGMDVEGQAPLLWIMLALGYMAPWCVIGSLVSHFKALYGPDFFVQLNCAYYLPGLPVSVLQQHLDEHADARFGSHRTYLWRNVLSLSVLILLLLAMAHCPDDDPNLMLFLTALTGVFSWLAHGTASMLVSMFPPASLAYLQTGFRMPELYTLAMVWALGIGMHPSAQHLRTLFYATAVLVALALACWVALLRSKAAVAYLHLKDHGSGTQLEAVVGDSLEEGVVEQAEEEERPLLLKRSHGNGHRPAGAGVECKSAAGGQLNRRRPSSGSPEPLLETGPQGRGVGQGSMLTASEKRRVEEAILPCRLCIFITMWSSIFQAAFFAYVPSVSHNNIAEDLYFIRLFADLVGRPLTRLHPRPWFLRTPWQLVRASICRLGLTLLFFLYITTPIHSRLLAPFRSDALIGLLVALFSLLSGVFSVLSYEYAARACGDLLSLPHPHPHPHRSSPLPGGSPRSGPNPCPSRRAALQAYSGSLMNSTFQAAAFSAVLSGLIFVDLRVV